MDGAPNTAPLAHIQVVVVVGLYMVGFHFHYHFPYHDHLCRYTMVHLVIPMVTLVGVSLHYYHHRWVVVGGIDSAA